MVKSCCVKNCGFRRAKCGEKLSLHKFPITDKELLQKWLDWIGYGNDWKPLKHAAICSRHFKPSDFRANTNLPRLLPNAVPSIKEKDLPPEFTEDDQTLYDDVQQEIVIGETEYTGDISSICRLCGNEYKCDQLKYIFDECAQKIFRCLHISISIEENLPLSICISCEKNLDYVENFLTKVENTQSRLQKQFNSSKISTTKTEQHQNDLPPELINIDNAVHNIPTVKMEEIQNKICQQFDYNTATTNTPINETEIEQPQQQTQPKVYEIMIPQYVLKPAIDIQRPIINHNYITNIINRGSPDPDTLNFKIPIKTETMTPCPEFVQSNYTTPPNKKIEILENIKIDPHQLDFMSIKSMCNDSVLKNALSLRRSDQVRPPNKSIAKDVDLQDSNHEKAPKKTTNKPPSNVKASVKTNYKYIDSYYVCEVCDTKFISKCALNNHVKFLCNIKQKNNDNNNGDNKQTSISCLYCKRTFGCNIKYTNHVLNCTYNQNFCKKSTKYRRKPAYVTRRQKIGDCSYLV